MNTTSNVIKEYIIAKQRWFKKKVDYDYADVHNTPALLLPKGARCG
jgi:hypothetical protein